MDAGTIIFLVMGYLAIGAVIGACINMNDDSTMWACIIFWPMIALIYACRGFIKILIGDKE